MRNDNIIGIDLAKSVFHVCVMNAQGRVLERKRLLRANLFEYVLKRGTGVVAFEACGGSQYLARRLEAEGFEVRQIAAKFVKPFVKSNKNDTVDAEAICEAASRPEMRFVSTRSEAQQDIQNLHRIRERLVRHRTGLSNEIRGFLMEYGIVIPQGIGYVRKRLHTIIEEQEGERSVLWRKTFLALYDEFTSVDERISGFEQDIKAITTENENCKRLKKVPGIGDIAATALVAAVGDANEYKNGRAFGASLGLVPRQISTGGKPRLGAISKRGDSYIRKTLILGAQALIIAATRKKNAEKPLNLTEQWLLKLAKEKGTNKAAVAMANKTARRAWHVLKGEEFMQPEQLLEEQQKKMAA